MGITESSEQTDSEYIEINHQEFTKIRRINSSKGKFLQIAMPITNQRIIEQWKQSYQSMKNNQTLFLPVDYQQEKSSFQNLCGSNRIFKINYPYYPYLLRERIESLAKQSISPQQNENVLYLLYVLVESASFFHNVGKKVGDIRPRNIFLNGQGGIKVGNIYSWPQETTNYEKYIFNKQITYISPEQVKESCFGHEQHTNIFLSQSFSIGLTLLDRILKIDSSDLYTVNGRFNYTLFESRINAMLTNKDNVDSVIKDIVVGLCNVDVKIRYNCTQVYRWLKQYQSHIVGKYRFHFDKFPPFMKSSVSTSIPNTQRNIYLESQVVPVSVYPGATFRPNLFKQQNLASAIANHHNNGKRQAETTSHQEGRGQRGGEQVRKEQTNMQGKQQKEYKITFKSKQQANTGMDSFGQKLKKIQEQLQQSRKMFPS